MTPDICRPQIECLPVTPRNITNIVNPHVGLKWTGGFGSVGHLVTVQAYHLLKINGQGATKKLEMGLVVQVGE